MIDRSQEPDWYTPYAGLPFDVTCSRDVHEQSFDEWQAEIDEWCNDQGWTRNLDWTYMGDGEFAFRNPTHAAMFALRFVRT